MGTQIWYTIFELSLKYPYYKTGELKIYQHGSLLLKNNGYKEERKKIDGLKMPT